MSGPLVLRTLVDKLTRFPGIGRRSAERMVHFILNKLSLAEVQSLSEAILALKQTIRFCSVCHNISQEEVCAICRDTQRNQSVICVVEDSRDVIAIEKTCGFKGVYHVLMGSLAPLEGRGPEDLTVGELINRLDKNNIVEVIIATDSDTEGEATALYLTKLLKSKGVKLSRIGMGLPLGSNIEYADTGTIIKALESRTEL